MIKKIIFWCGVFAMSFLVMVQPAQADGVVQKVTGTAAPTTNVWTQYSVGATAATPLAVCQLYAPIGGQTYTVGNSNGAVGFLGHDCIRPDLHTASGGVYSNFVCPSGYTRVATGEFTAVCNSTSPVCPANSTGTTTCTCNAGFTVGADNSSCISSAGLATKGVLPNAAYLGSAGGVAVCTSDGVCSGATTFSTPAAACADRATNGVYANAHIVAQIVPGTTTVCQTQLVYNDGTVGKISFTNMVNQVPCAAGDAACGASAASASAVGAAQATAANNAAAAGGSAASAVGAANTQLNTTPLTAAVGGSGGSGSSSTPPLDISTLNKEATQAQMLADLDKLAAAASSTGATSVGVAVPSEAQIYTKGTKTIADSFNGFTTSLKASPLVSAAGSFFDVSLAGACNTWSLSFNVLGQSFGTHVVDQFCTPPFTTYLPYIRALMLIIFSFVAFRVAIL
ncbi:MAG: hypothetical protein PHG89_11650 [Gallionella sp.]|nr:hypothetical protein [Gallionella sp.]